MHVEVDKVAGDREAYDMWYGEAGYQEYEAPEVPVHVDMDSLGVYETDPDRIRPLTEEELDSVACDAPEITLTLDHRYESSCRTTFRAENHRNFSVRELVKVVEKFEQDWRGCNGEDADAHHIYFEGFEGGENGVFSIFWGS